MTDESFVCAQGNKTLHYEQCEGLLYVFGNDDNCELGNFWFDDNDNRYNYIILKPHKNSQFPNASLYEIEETLTYEASGPNCSFFSNDDGEYYLFGSLALMRNFSRVINHIGENDIQKISCSRTHTDIWYLDEDGLLASLQFTEQDYSGKLPRFNADFLVFSGINCTFTIDPDGAINQHMLDSYLQSGGNGPVLPVKFTEKIAEGGSKPIKIACGDNHVMVLYEDGSFEGFGDNSQGQIPEFTSRPFKRLGSYQIFVKDIACGNSHTLVLLDNGSVLGFGRANFGQNKSWEISEISVRVHQIDCGNEHSLILREDNHVMGWGRNEEGQLANRSELSTQIIDRGSVFYSVSLYERNFEITVLPAYEEVGRLLIPKKRGGSKKKSQNKKKLSKKLKIKY